MLSTILALSVLAPNCPTQTEWLEDRSVRLGRDRRRAARARARRACRALGASEEACEILDVIAERESSYDPCAVHVLAAEKGEFGLGLHGISWELHWPKWFKPLDDDATPEAFRIPEVSTVIALRIFRRAVVRYHAASWVEVSAVFSGRISRNRAAPNDRDFVKFCGRLRRRGLDCHKAPEGLGTRLGRGPTRGQRAFVEALMP